MKSRLAIIFLFIIHLSVFAIDPKFYNINDIYGISIREVYSITKDQDGFIWAASKTGILRLSENSYKKYNLPYKSYDTYFTRLVYRDSLLIAYSNNSQIFKYDRLHDKFVLYMDVRNLLNNDYAGIKNAIIDKDQNIWIASLIGLFKYQNTQLIPIIKNEEIRFLHTINDELLFYSTPKGIFEINIYNKKITELYRFTRDNEIKVSSLLYDKEKEKLWIGSISNGLFSYDRTTKKMQSSSISKLPKQPILSIKKNITSSLLIGIDGQGLWELNEDGTKTLNIYKENVNNQLSLRGDGVYDILCEKDGRIWVATYTGGLSFFDQRTVPIHQVTHQINSNNTLVNNHVNKVIEDKKGNIWFATNNGICKWNPKSDTWNTYYSNKEEQAKVFLALCEDNEGNIWCGTYSSGIYVIDGDTGKELNHYFHEKEKSGYSGKFITSIILDSQKNIWMGGKDNIICYKSKEKQFKIYDRQSIYFFAELSSDKLLLACDYGLIVMDKNSGKKENLLNDCLVQDIYINGNDIWLATSGNGLIYMNYETKKTKKYTTESGLTSNYVNSIISENNYLWLGTENGLCLFNLQNNSVYVYPSSLQLNTVSFNMNSRWKLKNGNLIWGTNKGAISLNPYFSYKDQIIGNIFIEDIKILGNSIRENPDLLKNTLLNKITDLHLKYNQNNFTVELIPLINNSSESKFSWKLEGFDKNWSNPSSLGIITYTNLLSGNYQLKIKMYDSSGLHLLNERILNIAITPPFWKTWWFMFLIIVIIICSVIYCLKLYAYKLKQKHTKEKIRFFTGIAHDIRTSLTLICAPIEELRKSSEISNKSKYYLNMALDQSKRLLSVSTQLLDFQKVDIGKGQLFLEMNDVVALVSQRCLMFDEMSKQKDIRLNFSSNRTSYMTALDSMKIEKIVDNLISNALKYSYKESQVDITLTCNEFEWTLQIKDYGLGISQNTQKKLFREFYRGDNTINSKIAGSGIGLLLVKSYVQIHEGRISFESKENEGSTFEIVIPYKEIKKTKTEIPTALAIKNTVEKDELTEYNASYKENIPEKKMVMLIVEDNLDLQNFLIVAFQDLYTIHKANNGSEAWDMLQLKTPDIIISDVLMPEMNGFEFCKKLKSTFETSHIPIVLLTSLNEKENFLEGLGLGADDYVTKPFNVDILNQRIFTLLRNREIVRNRALKLIGKTDSQEDVFVNELNDKFVKKALKIVTDNMSNTHFGKEEFAFEMNVSSSLLYQKLKSLTGLSPLDFIRSIRFNHALELLKTRKYTVTEVSDICGFSSINYFSTAFKKYFGKSPIEI